MAEEDKKNWQKTKEEREKAAQGVIDHFKDLRGYNLSNDAFTLGHDANDTPVLKHKTNFKMSELPEGWKYGVYYLDTAYPRVGIWNEEGVFIPTESELDKSQVATYRDADDLANMLKATNERVAGTNVTFPGNNTIRIDGVDKIDLPTADLVMRKNSYGETVIMSTLNPEIEFRVEIVRSAEQNNENASLDAGGEGHGIGNETVMGKDAYASVDNTLNNPSYKPLNVRVDELDLNMLDWDHMSYADANYQWTQDGNVVRKEEYGDNQSLNTRRVETNRNLIAIMNVNILWKKAYVLGKGGDSRSVDALQNRTNAEFFDHVMQTLRNVIGDETKNRAPRFSNIAADIYNSNMQDKDLCKAIMHFIHMPEIAKLYGIYVDSTVQEAIDKAQERSDEMDDESVMTRKFPPHN
ncbi:MAG: hypothetical protein E7356_03225 [Clostridiales bacterium]|nr:hypothetical protein [Clostridiales bacterium]